MALLMLKLGVKHTLPCLYYMNRIRACPKKEVIDPFRAAVPFWGTSQIIGSLSPKWGCSPKRVKLVSHMALL